MKLNKLIIACGVLFAAGAGTQAFAVAPGPVRVLISGASALEISTQKAVADMCNPTLPASDRTFYRSANGNAYRCTSRTDAVLSRPFTAAHVMDIRKRNGGGSSFGVVQVAANTPVGFTDPASASCSAPTLVTIGGLQWNQRTGCGEVNLIPDAGVSDVEPNLFRSQGYRGGLTSTSIVAQVFGIPVNDKLYRKLQAVQRVNNWATEAAATAGDPNFLAINAPSLTYAQVRSLFSGSLTDWADVHSGITDAGNGSTFAKVCRRVATSGTQATINALLLNNPCGAGPFAGQLLPADNTNDGNEANDINGSLLLPTAGDIYTVVMNSGAGQVDVCLTDANVKNELAIGLLGTERISSQLASPAAEPNDDTDGRADQWHYVKLSGGVQTQQANPPGSTALDDDTTYLQRGAYPSVDNTIASTYDLYAEATCNRRSAGNGAPYTADQGALITKVCQLMGNPTTIRTEGLHGLAALHTNGYNPLLAVNYPTLKGTRNGNTCQPTTLQWRNP